MAAKKAKINNIYSDNTDMVIFLKITDPDRMKYMISINDNHNNESENINENINYARPAAISPANGGISRGSKINSHYISEPKLQYCSGANLTEKQQTISQKSLNIAKKKKETAKNKKTQNDDHVKYDDFVRKYKEYNTMSDWPETTNIRCWFCTLNFDTVPCALPHKKMGKTFYVYGCFCSFNCALAYCLKSKNTNKYEIISLLNLLYTEMFGEIKKIIPAPEKELLEEYGGNLTREQYRQKLENSVTQLNYILPPIIGIGSNTSNFGQSESEDIISLSDGCNPINFKTIDNLSSNFENHKNGAKNNDDNGNEMMNKLIKFV